MDKYETHNKKNHSHADEKNVCHISSYPLWSGIKSKVDAKGEIFLYVRKLGELCIYLSLIKLEELQNLRFVFQFVVFQQAVW